MKLRDHSIDTMEEREIRRLWMQRPAGRRTLEELAAFQDWLVSCRPELLPKGADDAYEYLARLLCDCVSQQVEVSA